MVVGRWSVVGGRWSVVGGRWSVFGVRCSVFGVRCISVQCSVYCSVFRRVSVQCSVVALRVATWCCWCMLVCCCEDRDDIVRVCLLFAAMLFVSGCIWCGVAAGISDAVSAVIINLVATHEVLFSVVGLRWLSDLTRVTFFARKSPPHPLVQTTQAHCTRVQLRNAHL